MSSSPTALASADPASGSLLTVWHLAIMPHQTRLLRRPISALLEPLVQAHQNGQPVVCRSARSDSVQVACLSRIVALRFEQQRALVLFKGLQRIEVRPASKHPADAPERVEVVRFLRDFYPTTPLVDREALRQRLWQRFREAVPSWQIRAAREMLIDEELSLGALCDVFATALPLTNDEKQVILQEIDVEQRVLTLLRMLGQPLKLSQVSERTRWN